MRQQYYLTPTKEELNIARSSEEYKNYTLSPYYDYLNKGYIKPWGYEYMAYQSNEIGIWILNVNQGCQTSVHCHFHKDTLLSVISGTFRIELYNNFKILNEGDTCFIPACMFHGIFAYSPNAVLLEVEIYHKSGLGIDIDTGVTHSDKNDLLRLRDNYTRDKNTYMGSVTEYILGDASGVDVVYPIYNLHNEDIVYGHTIISRITDFTSSATIASITNPDTYILLNGRITIPNGGCAVLSSGSVIENYASSSSSSLLRSESCEILKITNLYQDDNRKLIYTKTHLCDIMRTLTFRTGGSDSTTCGRLIGLTSGCFDIFHSGHIFTLKQGKQMCDIFFVCLSSDKQIREIKGVDRPINNIEDRARMLLTMPFIDYVILYDETDNSLEKELDNIMLIVKPDIWVKGSDYTEKAIRAKHPSLKHVVLCNNIENKSTTNIISRIQSKSVSKSNSVFM